MDAQAHILKDLLAKIASKEAEEEGTENGYAGEFLVSHSQNAERWQGFVREKENAVFRVMSCDNA